MYVGRMVRRNTESEFLALRPFSLSKLSIIDLTDAADEDDEEDVDNDDGEDDDDEKDDIFQKMLDKILFFHWSSTSSDVSSLKGLEL